MVKLWFSVLLYLLYLLYALSFAAQAESLPAVTIERQGSQEDKEDTAPASCQDLIEDNHRLRLHNEYLQTELTASIQMIETMKSQMEQLMRLQTQVYQKLELQFLPTAKPNLNALPPAYE